MSSCILFKEKVSCTEVKGGSQKKEAWTFTGLFTEYLRLLIRRDLYKGNGLSTLDSCWLIGLKLGTCLMWLCGRCGFVAIVWLAHSQYCLNDTLPVWPGVVLLWEDNVIRALLTNMIHQSVKPWFCHLWFCSGCYGLQVKYCQHNKAVFVKDSTFIGIWICTQ